MTALSTHDVMQLARLKHAYTIARELQVAVRSGLCLVWLRLMVERGKLGGPRDGERS